MKKKENLERDKELENTPYRMETEDLIGQEAQPAHQKNIYINKNQDQFAKSIKRTINTIIELKR